MNTKRIMIVAVGGQGNILAARILGEAAAAAGITPRMSEFHGMAQRGGVVESAAELRMKQAGPKARQENFNTMVLKLNEKLAAVLALEDGRVFECRSFTG